MEEILELIKIILEKEEVPRGPAAISGQTEIQTSRRRNGRDLLAAVPDHLEIVREWHKLGLGILVLEEG